MKFCLSRHFSLKSRMTEVLRRAQIYNTNWKLKNGLTDFNEIWLQQYSYCNRSRLCATFNFKIFKFGGISGGSNFFSFLHNWLYRKRVHNQNCVIYYFEQFPHIKFPVKSINNNQDIKEVTN